MTVDNCVGDDRIETTSLSYSTSGCIRTAPPISGRQVDRPNLDVGAPGRSPRTMFIRYDLVDQMHGDDIGVVGACTETVLLVFVWVRTWSVCNGRLLAVPLRNVGYIGLRLHGNSHSSQFEDLLRVKSGIFIEFMTPRRSSGLLTPFLVFLGIDEFRMCGRFRFLRPWPLGRRHNDKCYSCQNHLWCFCHRKGSICRQDERKRDIYRAQTWLERDPLQIREPNQDAILLDSYRCWRSWVQIPRKRSWCHYRTKSDGLRSHRVTLKCFSTRLKSTSLTTFYLTTQSLSCHHLSH